MAVAFAPQFFLLIGIDLFLAGSIVATLLEEYYPKPLAYIFDIASFIGFAQLWSGPTFLEGFSEIIQFYYCAGFALVSLASVAAANFYLIIIKRKPVLSIMFAMLLTIPGSLIMLFFSSAYVNGVAVQLPLLPVFSWEQIYLLFSVAAIMLILIMAFGLYQVDKKVKIKQRKAQYTDKLVEIH